MSFLKWIDYTIKYKKKCKNCILHLKEKCGDTLVSKIVVAVEAQSPWADQSPVNYVISIEMGIPGFCSSFDGFVVQLYNMFFCVFFCMSIQKITYGWGREDI